MGGLINLKEKCLIFGEKIPVFIIFSGEKENQRAIILVWFEVPVGVSSYNYV